MHAILLLFILKYFGYCFSLNVASVLVPTRLLHLLVMYNSPC